MNSGMPLSKRKQPATKVTITRSEKKMKTEYDEKNQRIENQVPSNIDQYSSEYRFIIFWEGLKRSVCDFGVSWSISQSIMTPSIITDVSQKFLPRKGNNWAKQLVNRATLRKVITIWKGVRIIWPQGKGMNQVFIIFWLFGPFEAKIVIAVGFKDALRVGNCIESTDYSGQTTISFFLTNRIVKVRKNKGNHVVYITNL